MYTYEQRMKAVELFIESGFSENAVCRELGYPSHNSLRSWYKEYQETGTFHESVNRKPKYTQEQKEAAVAYYFNNHVTIMQACRVIGYPSYSMLRQWISEAKSESTQSQNETCAHTGKRVKWTWEQRSAVIEDMLVNKTPMYKVAAKYDVSETTIYTWKRRLLGKDGPLPMKKPKNTPAKPQADIPDNTPTEETVRALKSQVSELEERIFYLQLELDARDAVEKLRKKEKGINLTILTNSDKAEVIDALRPQYRLKTLIRFFQIPKSSYFYHRKRLTEPDKYDELRSGIGELFEQSYHSYGYRRIQAALRNVGIFVSEKVIRRLMKEEGCVVPCKTRRRKYSSYEGEITPPAKNVIQRDFHADAPNQKWLTDITEFAIPAGKVYLSPVIDCYDGMPVAWTIGTHPNANLVNTMLDQAISTLNPDEHPVVHSDRGSHYRWPGWLSRMEQAHLTRSMSKKGCCPDNAACESVFAHIKNEMFYPVSWTGVSIEEFIRRVDRYLHWYAEDRIKLSLGGLSPAEHRRTMSQPVPIPG